MVIDLLQGGSIPPLVGVNLVLRGKEVLFNPSLSSVTTIRSVPEVVRLMLEDLLSVAQRLKRLLPTKEVSTINMYMYVPGKITTEL